MLSLKRIKTALDRTFRNEQNENLDKIEQANSLLQSQIDGIVDGNIDDGVLATNIEQKLNNLEAQYAPKLTEVSSQLAETEQIIGTNIEAFKRLAPENTDTGRLQRAMDEANNTTKVLLLDATTYEAVGVNWYYDVLIVGKGRDRSIIKKSGNGDVLTVVGSDQTNTPRFGKAMSFSIDGNKTVYSGNGIVGTKLRGFSFFEVEIKNCRDKGWHLLGSWDVTFLACWCRSNGYGFYDEALPDSNSNNLRWIGCHIEGNELGQIYSTSANAGVGGRNMQHYIVATKVEAQFNNSGVAGIYLDADSCNITGLYTYLSENKPLLYLKGERNIVSGGIFSTPKSNHAIVIEGDANELHGVNINQGSNASHEWVHIKSGSQNKITAVLKGGGSQNPLKDDGTNNFWDFIKPNGIRDSLNGEMRIPVLKKKNNETIGSATVPANQGYVTVTLSKAQPDTNYHVRIMPRWETQYRLTTVTTTSFTLNFTTPPTSQSSVQWDIMRGY